MEPHPLSQLLQDLTQLVANSGLRLELLADQYLASRNPSSLGKSASLQSGTYTVSSNSQGWAERETLLNSFNACNENTLKNDVLQNASLKTYWIENKMRLEEQFPQLTCSQIISKAAAEFQGLPQLMKIKYYKRWIAQSSTSNQDQLKSSYLSPYNSEEDYLYSHQINKTSKLTRLSLRDRGQSQFTPSFAQSHEDQSKKLSSITTIRQADPNNWMTDGFKRENEEAQSRYKKLSQNQLGVRKGEREEARGKNDIYKMVLTGKSGERQESQGSKGEDSKEKAQFQTLKSLFKKLQNTT